MIEVTVRLDQNNTPTRLWWRFYFRWICLADQPMGTFRREVAIWWYRLKGAAHSAGAGK